MIELTPVGTIDETKGDSRVPLVPPSRWLVLLPMAAGLIQPLCDSEVKEVNWILRLSAYS